MGSKGSQQLNSEPQLFKIKRNSWNQFENALQSHRTFQERLQLAAQRPKEVSDEQVTVRVFYTDEKNVEISWKKSRAQSMTTGWLLSEAIWRISEDEEWYKEFIASNQTVTALEAKREVNQNFKSTLDFYLTCYEKDLLPLRTNTNLQIVVSTCKSDQF